MGLMTRLRGALSRPDRAISVAGLVAAFAFAVIANVIAIGHYRRWDVTEAKAHSLSPATVETLRSLDAPVEVLVLLGSGEALRESMRHALEAYRAHTTQLAISFVDPDKEPARFEDLRRRFRLEGGRAEGGRAVENVAVIVARGPRHWFVERSDLVEVESAAEARVKPREERALTTAIRAVLSGDKTRVCFAAGHGEPGLDDFGPRGVGALAEILRKDNYEPVAVDVTGPGAKRPFEGCAVAIIATPRRGWAPDEVARLSAWLDAGGSALVALSPVASKEGFVSPGLGPALAPFGVALRDALVVETEPNLFFPESRGTQFIAAVRPHPVAASLAAEGPGRSPPPVVLELARPLARATEGGAASPVEVLATSDRAFGVVRVTEDTAWSEVPARGPSDLGGPLSVAMVSERPKLAPTDARGPRMVVVGTSSVLSTRGALDPSSVGSAFFAEGAISWLSARAPVLDIPDRPSVTAGVRLTAESIDEVKRYVLVLIPLTFAALGILVTWSRRRTPAKAAAGAR